MDKYGIPEEVAGALIDGMKYICFRLDRIYSKQEEFSPIAKLLLELSLSKRKDQENLVLEDLFCKLQPTVLIFNIIKNSLRY